MSKLKKIQLKKNPLFLLKEGDLVDIIAPGSAAPEAALLAGVEVLKSWGLRVRYAADFLKPNMYLAHDDKYRFKSFQRALLSSESQAVWCLRGGYGAIRILPQIEEMKIPKKQKLLIGFSDVTSIHAVINQKWKWPSLHASLIDRLGQANFSQENKNELQASLMNLEYSAQFKGLIPLNKAALKKKKILSQVVGGNLMVATSTLGTPSQLKSRKKILFFEEISERAYRIDRCLQQLKQARIFDEAHAVIFGDFYQCLERDHKDYVTDTLIEFFAQIKVPAFKGLQVGHADVQRPLYFNSPTVLTCGEQPEMINYSPNYEILKPRT